MSNYEDYIKNRIIGLIHLNNEVASNFLTGLWDTKKCIQQLDINHKRLKKSMVEIENINEEKVKGPVKQDEEKFYCIYLGDGQYLVSEDELKDPYVKIRHKEDTGFLNYRIAFTEKEIKEYNANFWPFKEPIDSNRE